MLSSSNNFCERAKFFLMDNDELHEAIKKNGNRSCPLLSNENPIKYIFDNKGFDIIIEADDFSNDYLEDTIDIAKKIKRHISNLKPNETKKIAVVLDGGNHCVGIVIGKTNEGKSYIFLDRENEKGEYLGKIEGLFLNELKNAVDRIILIPRIQSDTHSCFIYSYLFCQAFEKDIKAKELIEKAFKKEDCIYKNNEKFNGAVADELPLLMQLIYQRESDKLSSFIHDDAMLKTIQEISNKIRSTGFNEPNLNKLKEKYKKSIANGFFYEEYPQICYNNSMKAWKKKNHILGFLLATAVADTKYFLKLTDAMIDKRNVDNNKIFGESYKEYNTKQINNEKGYKQEGGCCKGSCICF